MQPGTGGLSQSHNPSLLYVSQLLSLLLLPAPAWSQWGDLPNVPHQSLQSDGLHSALLLLHQQVNLALSPGPDPGRVLSQVLG